jgi:glycerol uptake facilitator-like aquaporin
MKPTLLQRVGAECIGTYALVTAGCGAIMVNAQSGALTHVGVALTFGLVIMVMIAATGHISGAHFNPAVTVAFALTRHFPWREVAASLTLLGLFGNVAHLGATLPSGTPWQAFGLEVVLTAFLMFVIISVATDTQAVGQLAAIAIGGTVALDALFGGPISGASMNPARSLAPALVGGVWLHQWLYIIAPVIGASLGALIYQAIRVGKA